MSSVLLRALSLITVILLGYLLKRKNIVTLNDFPAISTMIVRITLPGAIISSFSKLDVQPSMIILTFLGIFCNALMVFLGYSIRWRRSKADRAFHMLNYAGYNIGSFALPYVQSFLGPAGFLGVCLFDAGNAVMCTGANYFLASSVVDDTKHGLKFVLKTFFSLVTVDVYIAMTILSLLHIRLPSFILSVADVTGAANPFLAMFILGVAFELRLSRSQVKKITAILLLRYGMSALFAVCFYLFLPFSEEIRQGLAVVVFAPLSSLCTIFTARIKGDVNLSGTLSSISIVVSIFLMTGLMLWMQAG